MVSFENIVTKLYNFINHIPHVKITKYIIISRHKRGAKLFVLIAAFTEQKMDEAIIHVRCVLFQVHPLTLKHRHSIRI